jgi:hypothetical protein
LSTSLLVLIELLVVFGLVFGFAGWELYKLRRERRRDEVAREGVPRKD